MTTLAHRAAAIERHRTRTGRFGLQPHADSGVVSLDGESPTEVRPDGTQMWKSDGQLDRAGAPAVIKPDGYRAYYTRGELDRADGPAVVFPDGSEESFRNGQRHCLTGPAVVRPESVEFWVDGVQVTPKEFARLTRRSS